jgi:sugar phosphate isomerase/epimerase
VVAQILDVDKPFRLGIALSPGPTSFAPLLFAGRLEAGVRAAVQSGFHAVELSLRRPEDVQPEALAALLDDNGLSLSAIATGQSCLYDALCLGDAQPEVRAATVERLRGMIQLAARFDAHVIIGGIRGRLLGTADEQPSRRAAAAEAIRECARFAARHGVTLLVEPINRYETNFVNTVAEGLALADEIGETSVKLLPDTFHMNIEEADMSASLRAAGDRLGYFHVADSNRQAPGQGHIDFPNLLQTLAQIGYRGYVTAEILPLPDDSMAMQRAGEFLNQLTDSMAKQMR